MKKLTTVIIAMLAIVASTYAQKVNKFGYLSSAELIGMMPEAIKADSVLQKYDGDLQTLGQQMYAEYQKKSADAQAKIDKKLLSDEQIELLGKELADLEKRIQDFQQSYEEKIQKKRDVLYTPIITKAQEAIKTVAKTNGFTYVFDSGAGSILFAEESDNILPLVKTYLKLPDPKPVAPKAGLKTGN